MIDLVHWVTTATHVTTHHHPRTVATALAALFVLLALNPPRPRRHR